MTSTSLAFVPGVVKSNVEAEPAVTARLYNIEKIMENLSKGFSELKKTTKISCLQFRLMVYLSQLEVQCLVRPLRVVVIELLSKMVEQEVDRQTFQLEDRVSGREVTAGRGKQMQSSKEARSSHLIRISKLRDPGTKLLVEAERKYNMGQVRLK